MVFTGIISCFIFSTANPEMVAFEVAAALLELLYTSMTLWYKVLLVRKRGFIATIFFSDTLSMFPQIRLSSLDEF